MIKIKNRVLSVFIKFAIYSSAFGILYYFLNSISFKYENPYWDYIIVSCGYGVIALVTPYFVNKFLKKK